MKLGALVEISLRFLFGKRESSAGASRKSLRGAVIGIAASLVPLVVVLEMADGMIEGIISRSVELGTYHAQVYLEGGGSLSELGDAARELRGFPGVKGAWAEREGLGLILRGGKREGTTIRAVDPGLLTGDPAMRSLLKVEEGKLSLDEPRSIVLGSELASALGAKAGDSVQLVGLRSSVGGSFEPSFSRFKVAAVVSSGYEELDGLWSFIRIDESLRAFSGSAGRGFVGVKTDSLSLPGILGSPPPLPLSLREGLPAGWYVESWYSLLESQYKSLMVTRLMLLLITWLIVLVASANVFSAVVMLVIERRQDIAILRGMGARGSDISLAFTLSGAFIGLAASVLGIALGLLAAVNVNEIISGIQAALNAAISFSAGISGRKAEAVRLLDPKYYLQEIPIRIGALETIGLALATILLSALAAWIPARRAGRIDPLEVMRKS